MVVYHIYPLCTHPNFPALLQVSGAQMGGHGLGQNVGLNQFGARQAAPQPSFGNQNPGMGSQEAQSVARYIEQQRALEAANHQAQQQKLLQQHRVFQMQVNAGTNLDAHLCAYRVKGGRNQAC